MDLVKDVLKDLLRTNSRKITIDEIQKKVVEHYNIKLSDMHSPRRSRSVARPRQVAMYVSRTLTNFPLKAIGDAFGGRDHGTVIHACKQVENMMEQDGTIKRSVDYLGNLIAKNNA